MKKEKFSFAKWLTTRDIEKIVDMLGLKLMKRNDDNSKYKIIRGKSKDGYDIVAFCEKKEPDEIDKIKSDIYKNVFSQFFPSAFSVMAMLAATNPESAKYLDYNNMVILHFGDFFLQELMSLKNEEEQIEYDRKLTKTYQNYMSQKFGKFYNHMKSAHYKSLYKKIREKEDNSTDEEKTAENM